MIKPLLFTSLMVLSTISMAHSDDYIKPTNKFIIVNQVLVNTDEIIIVNLGNIILRDGTKIETTEGASGIKSMIYDKQECRTAVYC